MGGESLEDMLGGFVTCVDFISLVGPVFSSFCHLDAFVHALMHLSDSFFTYCNCLFFVCFVICVCRSVLSNYICPYLFTDTFPHTDVPVVLFTTWLSTFDFISW